jgi:hypothetical protein
MAVSDFVPELGALGCLLIASGLDAVTPGLGDPVLNRINATVGRRQFCCRDLLRMLSLSAMWKDGNRLLAPLSCIS